MSISGKVDPVVRPVAATDIAEALVEGLRDFRRCRSTASPSVRSTPPAASPSCCASPPSAWSIWSIRWLPASR